MTDKAVALPGHTGFIKNNLRNYGMLLSLFAIMLFFQVMTDGTLLQRSRALSAPSPRC
jgi:putative multiple sugar transport system permease protein